MILNAKELNNQILAEDLDTHRLNIHMHTGTSVQKATYNKLYLRCNFAHLEVKQYTMRVIVQVLWVAFSLATLEMKVS